MSSFGRWLSRGKSAITASSEKLNLTAEAQNMDVALRAAEKILNDDIKGAEEALKDGDSAFHKLSKGTLGFMKATLGFEQDVMNEASNLLYEAENSAYQYHQKAQHDPSAFTSAIYDKGAEFLLCQAEAQIMSAIVGVLNESLTESIKGFYKMRKAYMTLESLTQMEVNFMKARGVQSLANSRIASKESLRSLDQTQPQLPVIFEPKSSQGTKPSGLRHAASADNDSDEDDFFEAEDKQPKQPPGYFDGYDKTPTVPSINIADMKSHPTDSLAGDMKRLEVTTPNFDAHSMKSEDGALSARPPLSRTTTSGSKYGIIDINADDEVFHSSLDVFIHSGTNLMFGIISLMISVIPPAFARLLSVVGFRGDRERGIRLLWQASKFSNVNGGMAALVLFGWYNGLIGMCDIYSDPDPEIPPMEQVEGYPTDRLRSLFVEMRRRYPDSHLWMIEEARMASASRDCDKALEILENSGQSDMKQLQALQMFEKSLSAQNAHKYELCAQSFLECVELNAWSQALYYFIAGAAYFQLSRDAAAAGKADDEKKFGDLAEEQFKKAPSFVGKKKMMGRQLPFDVYVQRKVNKWTANSRAWGCTFLEAIGVGPIEESIFLWNGHKRMNEAYLKKSLANLDLSEKSANWDRQGQDERTVLALLRATIHRNLRQHKEAQAILEKEVFPHDKTVYGGQYMDTWAAPAAYYEHAVNSWQQRNEYIVRFGSTIAGPSANNEKTPTADIQADAAHVASAKRHVEKAKNWGSYELDARIGIKVTAALGAIGKWEKRNGFA